MQTIQKESWVLHSAQKMYALVHDVTQYKTFVPYCVHSELIESEPLYQVGALTFAFKGVEQRVVTRNTLAPNESIAVDLVSGPFKHLTGFWRFADIEGGCHITLDFSFELSHAWLQVIFQPAFYKVSNELVTTFCQRADQLYGQ